MQAQTRARRGTRAAQMHCQAQETAGTASYFWVPQTLPVCQQTAGNIMQEITSKASQFLCAHACHLAVNVAAAHHVSLTRRMLWMLGGHL